MVKNNTNNEEKNSLKNGGSQEDTSSNADPMFMQGSPRQPERDAGDETGDREKKKDADRNAGEEYGLGEDLKPKLSSEDDVLDNGETGEISEEADDKDDHLADLQRLQAEYVNYRRRVERDRDVARETAVQGMVVSLLPVLDDIDAARQHGDLDAGPFAAIAQKLDDTLAKHGVKRYGETGVAFDPTIYEALLQQPSSEVSSETVSQVLRPGYRMGERIIRAAQVAVSVPE